jgi:hypothetical protein
MLRPARIDPLTSAQSVFNVALGIRSSIEDRCPVRHRFRVPYIDRPTEIAVTSHTLNSKANFISGVIAVLIAGSAYAQQPPDVVPSDGGGNTAMGPDALLLLHAPNCTTNTACGTLLRASSPRKSTKSSGTRDSRRGRCDSRRLSR